MWKIFLFLFICLPARAEILAKSWLVADANGEIIEQRNSDTVQPMLSQTPNALVEAAVAEQSFAAAPPLAGDSAYDYLNEGLPLGDAEQAALTDNIDASLRPSQYNQVMARET